MMGIKERNFRPIPDNTSLDNLVPSDNFYRRLEEQLGLSFVRADVLRGGVSSGPRAVLRRHQGRSQCLAGLYEVALAVSIPVPARPP